MTTGDDGTYKFELVGDVNQQQLTVSKDLYKETIAGITVEKTDESGWLTDVLYNKDFCLEKKLVIKT